MAGAAGRQLKLSTGVATVVLTLLDIVCISRPRGLVALWTLLWWPLVWRVSVLRSSSDIGERTSLEHWPPLILPHITTLPPTCSDWAFHNGRASSVLPAADCRVAIALWHFQLLPLYCVGIAIVLVYVVWC